MTASRTVLVLGSTGHIGISAIHGALAIGLDVIVVVRNRNSAQKLHEHITEGQERIRVVEADVVADQGVQGVVDKVPSGAAAAVPPCFLCYERQKDTVGGYYQDDALMSIETEALRSFMAQNFESNFLAYRATVPYLLEQTDCQTTWTICTGAQGDIDERPLPAMSQGALFSFCVSAEKALANTNVRFREIYLATRVQVDSSVAQSDVIKASVFGRVYENILPSCNICSRV